jgi:SAM-dependent methyltransferase
MTSSLRAFLGSLNLNSEALKRLTAEFDVVKLNIKQNGYALARRLAENLPVSDETFPQNLTILSKPSTQVDLESQWARYWCQKLKVPVVFHRKLWELTYVSQVLWQCGMLAQGKIGLGFGCGTEPLPSLYASLGSDVTVTDLAAEEQAGTGWISTNQHTHSLDAVYQSHLVDRSVFNSKVSLRYIDMRKIPDDLRDYDFCWSICALEHLGSIAQGLKFIEESLRTLKPGGIAVHTTELNYLSEDDTIDNCSTVLFLRKHFKELAKKLSERGHWVAPLDFDVGQDPMDLFIDLPPYPHDWTPYQAKIWPSSAHMKLSVDGYASTCFAIVVRRGQ